MSPSKQRLLLDCTAAAAAAELFKALAHPLRLRIVAALASGPLHVTALSERLEAPQPFVSQQLRRLKDAGLIEPHTKQGHTFYQIAEPHLFDMLECLSRCMRARKKRGLL